MVFECPHYAAIREHFSMLYTFLDGEAQTWSHLSVTPDSDAMRCFIHQNPVLVAAFVHACWRVRAEPDLDPAVVLTSADICHAVSEAVEFYSACSSLPTEDEWFDTAELDDTP